MSFVVNCNKLSHPSDIRMDDLGSWVNGAVDKLYVTVQFTDEKKVQSVRKLSYHPSVVRKSMYCLTRSYWKHKQNPKFCRQLHQIAGKFYRRIV